MQTTSQYIYNHTYTEPTLGPTQTTSYSTQTLITTDLAEYNTRLNLQSNNTILDMHTHPKTLILTIDIKLTYNNYIDNKAAKASKTMPILKVFSSTKWGEHKETLLSTSKAVTRPILSIVLHTSQCGYIGTNASLSLSMHLHYGHLLHLQ